eukprot:CAMPEP_0172456578 /NCGR_PEP_ID=MMETSP1065-20121228/16381_1 /TAXON_ID=265537 /ORGANISM="Amphiprora paludosa, Strain CCMP125" /LENGTH=592 /DNA_ID=CAMNT_0013209685 /DNA_START=195 /DNA_END=1973 /DNA_ORIENTATION=+
MHELCKGFGALLSRSKNPGFPEEASRLNDRGNLPLHAACSFQATADVIDALLRAYPGGASQPNSAGNLPIHQAAMWQASTDAMELLLGKYPEGATVRNQYGSLPLHMAASNQASPDVVRLLINAYPDALHLQNDDGMTPLDLALADESASEAVVAMLEGRPPPPELTRRQQAEKLEERAKALERKLYSLRDGGNRRDVDLKLALSAVRRLADRVPHALFAAGMDPNELEIAFSDAIQHANQNNREEDAELILLDAVKKRHKTVNRDSRGMSMQMEIEPPNLGSSSGPRDRVEDLLASIVGLEHVKSQVRGLRRTAEISDLRESLMPMNRHNSHRGYTSLLPAGLAEDSGRPVCSHAVFTGNPGTGKTAVARLLAKVFHELGLLRKPKFLEVERMDLVARDKDMTILKTREVLDEARGGVLFIDEAFTLGMASKRNRIDTGNDCIMELVRNIDAARTAKDDTFPLIILAGFPLEVNAFLAFQPELRKRFPTTFEFPDYTCTQLARIFLDLATAKGFEFDTSINEDVVSALLQHETTSIWRGERNGRVSEMLLSGVRSEVRRRMRKAQLDGQDDFDPQLIVKSDIENVMRTDFK